MTLGEFLLERASSADPWHCSTLPADWCVALGHPDFAAAWRGLDDPAECERLPAEAGGLLVLWAVGIDDGLPLAPEPLRAGDIAVVRIRGSDKGAIWTGLRWAVEGERCLHFLATSEVEPLGVWRP